MKIYTKKGDDGTTFIPTEGRVKKCDCSVDAQGEIDELNCWIGMIFRQVTTQDVFISNLNQVQIELMEIGAQLATGNIMVTKEKIDKLEDGIDEMNKSLPNLSNFILPDGENEIAVLDTLITSSYNIRNLNSSSDSNIDLLFVRGWISTIDLDLDGEDEIIIQDNLITTSYYTRDLDVDLDWDVIIVRGTYSKYDVDGDGELEIRIVDPLIASPFTRNIDQDLDLDLLFSKI